MSGSEVTLGEVFVPTKYGKTSFVLTAHKAYNFIYVCKYNTYNIPFNLNIFSILYVYNVMYYRITSGLLRPFSRLDDSYFRSKGANKHLHAIQFPRYIACRLVANSQFYSCVLSSLIDNSCILRFRKDLSGGESIGSRSTRDSIQQTKNIFIILSQIVTAVSDVKYFIF